MFGGNYLTSSGGMSLPFGGPTHVEVAFMMSQSIMRSCVLPNNLTRPPKDILTWNTVSQWLQKDLFGYCHLLANVIIQLPTRSAEGNVIDNLLEVFVAAFVQQGLPSSMYELDGLAEPVLKQVLTEMFMRASQFLLTVLGSSSSSSSAQTVPANTYRPQRLLHR